MSGTKAWARRRKKAGSPLKLALAKESVTVDINSIHEGVETCKRAGKNRSVEKANTTT